MGQASGTVGQASGTVGQASGTVGSGQWYSGSGQWYSEAWAIEAWGQAWVLRLGPWYSGARYRVGCMQYPVPGTRYPPPEYPLPRYLHPPVYTNPGMHGGTLGVFTRLLLVMRPCRIVSFRTPFGHPFGTPFRKLS